VRHDAHDHTGPHPNQPRCQSQNPQQTEESRTDRRSGTALLTGGLLACPEALTEGVRIPPEEPLRNRFNKLRLSVLLDRGDVTRIVTCLGLVATVLRELRGDLLGTIHVADTLVGGECGAQQILALGRRR
jgi:hypothetical protein